VPRLDRVDRAQLHATFQEAFADYAVDMSSLNESLLEIRFTKNAVDWQASVGAFDGDRMVGFTMIAIDDWQGRRAAFDAATGIVPDFRGRGLAREMFDWALPGLREKGVERFVLEVMAENEPAIRAYEKTGFAIRRRLSCLGLNLAAARRRVSAPGRLEIRTVDRKVLLDLEEWVDWQPSWENSFAALARIPEQLVALGAFVGQELVGGIGYSPSMNWIMTLVVRPSRRRQGIGSALLQGLVAALPEEQELVKLLNVDSEDLGMRAFLEARGFHHLVDQFEMDRAV
jgi:ribosomal protein S18 acetylase RimI-like enzyme